MFREITFLLADNKAIAAKQVKPNLSKNLRQRQTSSAQPVSKEYGIIMYINHYRFSNPEDMNTPAPEAGKTPYPIPLRLGECPY